MSRTVYMFLDESGNLDFSERGTKYFVLTSVCIKRPFGINSLLESYKYDLLEWGLEQEYFHCSEDNRHVRAGVIKRIAGYVDDLRVDSVIVEKRKTAPALTMDRRFYPEMLGRLVKYVIRATPISTDDEVIIITDTIPIQRKRQAIQRAIKVVLARMMPERPKYRLLHHDSRSHYGIQIADYCAWAIFRKHEQGDTHTYQQIREAVRSEFDIFCNGTAYYY